ncbi:MAG: PadR family transcriptional regulator [Firmicutes bacterium]|nr:PadR family transcriptional regulator [Bacillota bacterium]
MGEQKGALTEGIYYILLSLVKPLHGYGIMQNVEALTGGRLKLAAGTLYGAIVNMIEKGWIKALPVKKNSRKKEYIITEAGKSVLKDEIRRLEELLQNGNKIFEEPMQ